MKTTTPKANALALLPIGVFLVIFLGSGIITGDFYAMPAIVAFLIALCVAFFQNKTLSFNEKIKVLDNELNKLKSQKEELKGTTDKTKELAEILKQKVNSKSTIDKIISSLLERIVVSKICNDKNNMELNIFLSYKENDETKKLQPILRSSYEFKRGYDTRGTKRYKVNYQVNCYFCL